MRKKEFLGITLSTELIVWLKSEAAKLGISVSSLIEMLLRRSK